LEDNRLSLPLAKLQSTAKTYCSDLIAHKCCQLPFHNLLHTEEVVSNVKLLTNELALSPEETEVVVIAAWFHDTGFSKTYSGHEEESKKLAKVFLEKLKYASSKIESILCCIDATKLPQQPENKYAEILCDADVFHIGTPNFFYKKMLLRRELELKNIRTTTELEWCKINLDFLEGHNFKTTYGKDVLEKGKQENIKKIQTILTYF